MNEFFIGAVAAGRKLTLARTRELADGRVHIARDAVTLDLIDGVQTFEQTVTGLRSGRRSTASGSRTAISGTRTALQNYGTDGWHGLLADKLNQGKTHRQAAREIASELRRE